MINVEKTATDFRVTISKDAVPLEQFNSFLDWLRLEEAVQRSRLSEEDANRLAEDSKSEWWTVNRHRFIPPTEP